VERAVLHVIENNSLRSLTSSRPLPAACRWPRATRTPAYPQWTSWRAFRVARRRSLPRALIGLPTPP